MEVVSAHCFLLKNKKNQVICMTLFFYDCRLLLLLLLLELGIDYFLADEIVLSHYLFLLKMIIKSID